VWHTPTLRGADAERRLREVDAEAMALAAFAALVPDNILALAPRGILNVHPSLLPRWRGAAPIQSALLAGDPETGVSIMRLVAALDAGPVFVRERVAIDPSDDYVTLEPRLAALGAALLVRVLREWPAPWPQAEDQATFSRKIERADARIDWGQPSTVIWRQVRAYRGWPQAFTSLDDGRLLKVLRAAPIEDPRGAAPGTVRLEDGLPVIATGDGALRLDEVQLEGRRAMAGADFARGYSNLDGTKLA
jgi:methionyl-tRNA formyltransferase